jgi:hypothetical protein
VELTIAFSPDFYSIVPYINPKFKGSISGIVGSGGNVGAVAFGFCFRQMTAKAAFMTMGFIILFSSILSIVVFIPGQSGLIWKTTVPAEPLENTENCAIEDGDKEKASNSVVSRDTEPHLDLSDHASNSDEGSL